MDEVERQAEWEQRGRDNDEKICEALQSIAVSLKDLTLITTDATQAFLKLGLAALKMQVGDAEERQAASDHASSTQQRLKETLENQQALLFKKRDQG